ncbi:MAG: flagellar hook-basal body complex protein FliE [Planctomycetota bacterium]|nr:flagellar hook-basal body complex protein FliE [Planctomycetota bacterium]
MSTIGGNMGLGRSNIEQALRTMQARTKELQAGATSQPKEASFDSAMAQNVTELNNTVNSADKLHLEAMTGQLDFHEVAGRVKEAQLSFNFAMQVRNKLIDSYREIMRMSV